MIYNRLASICQNAINDVYVGAGVWSYVVLLLIGLFIFFYSINSLNNILGGVLFDREKININNLLNVTILVQIIRNFFEIFFSWVFIFFVKDGIFLILKKIRFLFTTFKNILIFSLDVSANMFVFGWNSKSNSHKIYFIFLSFSMHIHILFSFGLVIYILWFTFICNFFIILSFFHFLFFFFMYPYVYLYLLNLKIFLHNIIIILLVLLFFFVLFKILYFTVRNDERYWLDDAITWIIKSFFEFLRFVLILFLICQAPFTLIIFFKTRNYLKKTLILFGINWLLTVRSMFIYIKSFKKFKDKGGLVFFYYFMGVLMIIIIVLLSMLFFKFIFFIVIEFYFDYFLHLLDIFDFNFPFLNHEAKPLLRYFLPKRAIRSLSPIADGNNPLTLF